MVSFTGSTRAGVLVAKAAADTVKRVTLELGGKSPNIFFADADFEAAIDGALFGVFINQGEVCSAGKGSKGGRWYAWAWLATASPRHARPSAPGDGALKSARLGPAGEGQEALPR